jgi:YVTN family beta-propeller protein
MKNIFRVLGFVAAGMLGCAMSSSQLYAQSTFVYVNNSVNGANSVSAFVVGTGGALTAVPGSPFLTGGTGSGVGYFASNAIAATVVGNFLFASDSVSNDIAAFSIGTSTGALTPVPGSPFAYGTEGESNPNGISLAVTPNGRFLFAGDSMSADIWAFSIASDGALTAVPGSPFASPTSPDGINVTRDGRYVAVALFDGLEVAMFSIGPSGALTAVPGSPFLTGGSASGTGYVEINCASNLLFASQFSEGFPSIAVETIAGGALNAIRGSPFTFAAGANSNVGVLSPNDNFLFVSNQNSDTISSLSVAAGGALAEVTGSPFANPGTGTPTLMGTNQAGTLLYVSNDGYSNHNTVNAFTISGAGGLTLVPGSPFDTGAAGKSSLTVFPPKTCSAVTSTPGPFAYVTNINSNTVSVINIPTSTVASTIPVGSGPWGVAVSPDQTQVYVSNNHGNNVSVINTASDTVVATIPVQSSPFGVAFTPDGTEAYVVNGSSNSVSVINTASQTVVATVPVQHSPVGVAMALTSNGTFAYVTNSGSNSVSVIAVSSSTVVQTIAVGSGPRWVAIAPNSSLAYVENAGSNTVSVISVATNTVTATIPVGLSPFGAAFTPDSSLAYVVNSASNTVSEIDTATSSVIATVTGFSNPVHVALSTDGSSAYVTNLGANNVSLIATATNTVTGTVGVGSAPIDIAIAAAPPTSQQITQPLSPTMPNVFNFGTNAYQVQYPAGTNFSNIDMTVNAVQLTQAQFQLRVAGTQFANATCIVYSSAGGNCVDDEVTCSQNGSPISCPSEAQPTIAVQTTFTTLQGIVNPGYLTTPIGENDWTNIFSGFSDPTVKGKTSGFSEFVAVSLGANNPQGLAKFQILYPILPKNYSKGQAIPFAIRLTSLATGKPITDAEASIAVVMTADAHGNPTQKTVFSKTDAFAPDFGANAYLFTLQAGNYAAGTYTVTIYGNAFPAYQGQFILQ